jgi:hypothetical protein
MSLRPGGRNRRKAVHLVSRSSGGRYVLVAYVTIERCVTFYAVESRRFKHVSHFAGNR